MDFQLLKEVKKSLTMMRIEGNYLERTLKLVANKLLT